MKSFATPIVALVVAVSLAACGSEPTPTEPAAQRLSLHTQTRYFDACNDALLMPVRFTRVGAEADFASVATGGRVEIIWPKDFTAWLVGDQAQLLDSFGAVIAREGDVLDNVGGSGEPWHACSIGGKYYR